MTLFFKKKAASSASSLASTGSGSSQNHHPSLAKNLSCLFSKFDEKKDYVRRCSLKSPATRKAAPCSVSLCLGKKL